MNLLNFVRVFLNKKILNSLSVKLPVQRSFYGKNAKVIAEEYVDFKEVRFQSSEIKIGAHSYMHSGEIYMVSSIGRFCSIAERVVIGVDPTSHPLGWLSTHPFQYSYRETGNRNAKKYTPIWDDTVVGNDVWIGQEAMIMKGITIGNGAVIAARSVVTKDVPAYAIVAGVPAKIIKYRFPEEIIDKLNQSNWWDLHSSEIEKLEFDCIERCLVQLADREFGKAKWKKLSISRNKKQISVKYDC